MLNDPLNVHAHASCTAVTREETETKQRFFQGQGRQDGAVKAQLSRPPEATTQQVTQIFWGALWSNRLVLANLGALLE